jgi:two-component system, NarL family, sensor histidine kinase UhpB
VQTVSRNRSLIITAFLIGNLFIGALAGYFLYQSKVQDEQRAETLAQNIAKAVDLSLSSSLEKADLALRAAADQLARQGAKNRISDEKIETLLATSEHRIPDMAGMHVTDAAGLVIHGRQPDRRVPASYAQRDFFPLLRDHPDAGLQITNPMVGRTSHKWIIALVRRYSLADGRFGGVVTATITLDHLNALLAQFDIGPHGGITLRDTDLSQLARYPKGLSGQVEAVGNTVVSPELKKLVQSGVSRATYHTKTPIDNIDRTLTFHRLAIAPMVVTVGLASTDYLAQWRNEVIKVCVLVGSFMVFSLWVALVMLRSQEKIASEGACLLKANEHLRRLITEYKLTSQALIASDRRYSALFANKISAIAHCQIITDQQGQPVDYRILQINEAHERIIGIRKADIEGRTVRDVFPGIENSSFDYINAFGKIALEGGEASFETFFEPTRQYLSIYAYSPSPGEFTTIFTDITDRRRADEALRRSERALTEAQRVAHIGNWRWDANSDEIWWSDELYRIYQKAPGAVLPSFEEALKNYTPESAARLADVVQKVWQVGEPYVIDLERRASAGPRRWVQTRGEAVLDESGKIVGLRGTAQDITELKRAEESLKMYAQRLIVLEEDLRKKISRELHDDVGQELTALSLNLAHLARNLPQESREELQAPLDDSRMLTKEISRSVRNLMAELRPSQLDEYGLASAVRSYGEQVSLRTGVAVVVHFAPEFPRLTPKTEVALFRIVQEALNNISKHAFASRVSICLEGDSTFARLSITDNGKGFLPQGAVTNPTGSGWGLIIMRERAELAGGRFWLDSAPGKGTVITVEIQQQGRTLPHLQGEGRGGDGGKEREGN